jgi:protein-L-isoaspartate(D-aspartate) O-methyltransferase
LGEDKEREERFRKDRLSMVEGQLRRRGISGPRVLQAMAGVPRHVFVSPEEQNRAYEDRPLPIGEGQTISQPYMVAVMSQSLSLRGHETVLEIGTGSGYQTAVLAELAQKVYTIERIPALAFMAQKTLHELGYRNIQYREGDGTRGWPEEGPFDGIIVTAGAPVVPETLKSQLADGGRLSIPVGPRSSQTLLRLTRQKDRFTEEEMMGCVFVPLVGDFGWDSE